MYIYIFVYLAIFFSVLRFRHLTPTSGGYNSSSACCLGAIHPGEGRRLLVVGTKSYKALQFLEINFGAERKREKTHSFLKRWASKKHHNGTWQFQVTRAQTSQGVFREALKSFFFVGINLNPLVAKCHFFFWGGGVILKKERNYIYIYIYRFLKQRDSYDTYFKY